LPFLHALLLGAHRRSEMQLPGSVTAKIARGIEIVVDRSMDECAATEDVPS